MPTPVLVVHNEKALRELALGTLHSAGLSAVGFGDPMTALDAIEADPRVRVLVTRVNFGNGKLNGVALARMVAVKRPGVKTVFIAESEYQPYIEGVGEFLPLPLNHHHLVDVVARLLCIDAIRGRDAPSCPDRDRSGTSRRRPEAIMLPASPRPSPTVG